MINFLATAFFGDIFAAAPSSKAILPHSLLYDINLPVLPARRRADCRRHGTVAPSLELLGRTHEPFRRVRHLLHDVLEDAAGQPVQHPPRAVRPPPARSLARSSKDHPREEKDEGTLEERSRVYRRRLCRGKITTKVHQRRRLSFHRRRRRRCTGGRSSPRCMFPGQLCQLFVHGDSYTACSTTCCRLPRVEESY